MTGAALWPGAVALIAALMVVTRSSIVHALMYLVAMLLALAAVFFALGAGFAGALQILIYAGAIVAVFVFVVMTVDSTAATHDLERARLRRGWRAPALLAALVLLPLVRKVGSTVINAAPVPVKAIGALLFGPWAIAVELASFLLLGALLTARHLARREDER
jgi:NADH-quinone oxidoreductase subunit J